MGDFPRLLVRFQQLAIFRHACQPESRQPVVEPRANHLLLFLAQMDAALIVNQLADKLKIGISNLHDSPMGDNHSIGAVSVNIRLTL